MANSSYSSALSIEELDSDRTVLRALTLVGPGMPKWGAAWPIENAMSTTWYPGNPDQATQQVLVLKEMPSTWDGEWNITRLLRHPQTFVDNSAGGSQGFVASPGTLADLFEDFARRGMLLRVIWLTDSQDTDTVRKIVREGRIKRFEPKYRTSIDIKWAVTFDWISRGVTQSRVAVTSDPNVAAAASSLSVAASAAQVAAAALIAAQNNPTTFTLGQLEQIADYPLELVGTVNAALESAIFSFGQIWGSSRNSKTCRSTWQARAWA